MAITSKNKNLLKLVSKKAGIVFLGLTIIAVGFTEIFLGGSFSLKTKSTEAASCTERFVLDTSFNPGTGPNNGANTVIVQPDGKILISGAFTNYNGTARNRIARINPDGSLDATFNPGLGANNSIADMVLQPDGKIVIGGTFTSYNGVARNRLARINPDGSLDTTFTVGSGPNGFGAQGLLLQPDGKIVIIGGNMSSYNGVARNRIARINANGSLDTTFANVTTHQPTTGNTFLVHPKSMVLQPDGKIIIGGLINFPNPNSPQNMAASIRINTNGTIDSSYNHNLATGQNWSMYPEIQPDGKIIFLIRSSVNSRYHRINSDGSEDSSFNNPPQANYNIPLLLDNGKMLVQRNTQNINRLNSDGSFDTSFELSRFNGTVNFIDKYGADKILITGWFNAFYNPVGESSVYSPINHLAIITLETVCVYDVSYASSDGGYLTGELEQTIFQGGESSEVTATPNPGYEFTGWSDGSMQNPRIDTNVSSDISVTANFAIAQPCDVTSTETSARINGYGWMGVNIQSGSNQSQGSGGWIRFDCDSGQQDFGAKVNFDQNSPNYGKISGNAWSNNYGWLTFEEDLVQSCWANSPGETASSTARVLLGNTQNVTSTGTNLGSGGGAQGVNQNSSTELTLAGGTAVEGTQAGQNLINQVGTVRPTEGVVQNTQPGQNLSNEVRPTRPVPGVLTNNPGANTSGVTGGNLPIVGWAKFINGDDFDNDGYTGCVSFSGSNYAVSLNPLTGALNGWAWGSDVIGWLSFQNPQCPFCDAEVDVPDVCEDPLATNYMSFAECVYEPIQGCTDSSAGNYNPAATVDDGSCVTGIPGCMDSSFDNYNPAATVDDGSCSNGPNNPPRTTLNLTVSPISFTVGSPNQGNQFAASNITWTSNDPSDIAPNSCVGSFSVQSGGLIQTATLTGWTGSRVNPNSSIPSLVIPQASSVTNTNTQLVFTITCQTLDGGTLTATDNIIFTAGPQNSATLELRIDEPNSNPPSGATNFEILGPAGNNVTLGWDSEDVITNSCVASSIKTPATEGSNNQWEGPVSDDGSRVINMLIPGNGNGVSTQFRITCTELDGLTPISRVVNVCIADTLCPVNQSGLFPSYQEF